jgi:hypothetical protein
MSELDIVLKREVPASVDAVWNYVVAHFFDNHRRWDPAIVALKQLTPGPVGIGTRGIETRNFGGRQDAEFVVTSLEPKRRFAFANTTGPFKLERQYDFAGDSRTQLSFHFHMAPKGVMRLLFPLLKGVIARQVASNIDRLCGLLATQPDAAGAR